MFMVEVLPMTPKSITHPKGWGQSISGMDSAIFKEKNGNSALGRGVPKKKTVEEVPKKKVEEVECGLLM